MVLFYEKLINCLFTIKNNFLVNISIKIHHYECQILDPYRFETLYVHDLENDIFISYKPCAYYRKLITDGLEEYNKKYMDSFDLNSACIAASLESLDILIGCLWCLHYDNSIMIGQLKLKTNSEKKLFLLLSKLLKNIKECVEFIYIPNLRYDNLIINLLSSLGFFLEESSICNHINAKISFEKFNKNYHKYFMNYDHYSLKILSREDCLFV